MKCKYYGRCEQADPMAMTCTENGGGTYCGKFRVLSAESKECASGNFLFRPVVHIREMFA
ncbi:hypothetical protein SAMN04488696_1619 [Methanolobus profundi]|uniref:Uncharacterized protein n=2 Tax=Methanolobus profundi TaxID=487685 RepID=A0A1I4RW34_9EURY|nr:hypothetical protein SAMN04488696_1619 [Methanolobus profundi]